MTKRMGNQWAILISTMLVFALASFYAPALSAQTSTVKTNHSDVNLWSGAGRPSHETIGSIKRYEEIQVLATKRLKNGEVWYRVQLRRFPGWRKQEQTGWVDAKFFTSIETPVTDDQPPESATEAQASCVNCAVSAKSAPIPKQQTDDIAAVGKAISSKGGFAWPVGGYVRSGFGNRRHPIKGVVKLHKGTDISGNAGAKVKAAKGGVVEVSAGGCKTGRKSCNKGAGNMVTINHGDGTKTRYFHLSPGCRLPKRGTRVSQGAILGCVGATGAVTGPHLHFEVIKNGKWINPLTVLPKRR